MPEAADAEADAFGGAAAAPGWLTTSGPAIWPCRFSPATAAGPSAGSRASSLATLPLAERLVVVGIEGLARGAARPAAGAVKATGW